MAGLSGDDALNLAKSYVRKTLQGQGALKGEDGKSAYQVAVDNGFIGTEQEWLDSLKAGNVEISKEENNALEEKEDGLYVPAVKEAKVSAEANNIISAKEDGLFAEHMITEILIDGTAIPIIDKKVDIALKAVTDLENYYDKEKIDDLLEAITTLKISVVDALPSEDISTTTIYLLPKAETEEQNVYLEYICLDTTIPTWECIGDTKVDLSEYAKNDEVLSLDGGTMTKNASITIPSANLAGGITLKDDSGYTATLTPDCLHIVDEENNTTTVGASGVYSPKFTGDLIGLASKNLPLAGGDMGENARIVIQNNNYMAGFIAKCNNASEAWLDGEIIGVRNYAYPHEYSAMEPTTIVIGDDDGAMSITKTDVTFGDKSKKTSSTSYGTNIIDSINEHNAFFGLNLWSNGGEIDHNMYCFQSDSFFAELYTGQPNLGNANAKWDNVYAETSQITTSDRREKTDIIGLDDEVTKKMMMALKPSSYKFVDNTSGRTHYGLIAQDVEDVMKDLGMTSQDFAGFIKSPKMIASEDNPREKVVVEGEYVYGLRYEEFIAPIIKVLQMQQKEIENLKNVVEKFQKSY